MSTTPRPDQLAVFSLDDGGEGAVRLDAPDVPSVTPDTLKTIFALPAYVRDEFVRVLGEKERKPCFRVLKDTNESPAFALVVEVHSSGTAEIGSSNGSGSGEDYMPRRSTGKRWRWGQ